MTGYDIEHETLNNNNIVPNTYWFLLLISDRKESAAQKKKSNRRFLNRAVTQLCYAAPKQVDQDKERSTFGAGDHARYYTGEVLSVIDLYSGLNGPSYTCQSI